VHISIIDKSVGADIQRIDSLIASLARAGHEVEQATSLAGGRPADVYLLWSRDMGAVSKALAAAREKAADRLPRTILVGISADFHRGFPAVDPGTGAELLETYGLGGCLAPQALSSWQEAPSWFAGPKALMSKLGSNAIKMFQSASYALWFSAPGDSLEAFLESYLPVLDEWVGGEEHGPSDKPL
jgi:hypothetical protein